MTILLLTRPIHAARRFLTAIESGYGPVRAVISPLMRIDPLPAQLPAGCKGIVLTSENGAAQVERLGAEALPAFCVGDRTAAAAGTRAVSAGGDANALVALLSRIRPETPLAHLRGEHARGNVAQRLTAAGLPCADVSVYAQTAIDPTPEAIAALQGNEPVVLPLFSPRSALLVGVARAPVHVIAMSAAVADEAAAIGATTVTVAERPDAASMLAATCRRIADLEGQVA